MSKLKNLQITNSDKKLYELKEKMDREILLKCKNLLLQNISNADKEMVLLIKSQLLKDWRKPLLKKLDLLLRKYK